VAIETTTPGRTYSLSASAVDWERSGSSPRHVGAVVARGPLRAATRPAAASVSSHMRGNQRSPALSLGSLPGRGLTPDFVTLSVP
jgi:hypothetical protein